MYEQRSEISESELILNFIHDIDSKFEELDSKPCKNEIKLKEEKFSPEAQDLIKRAKTLIEKSRGILYKSTQGILKFRLKLALEKHDFADLIEYVPKFEKRYVIKKMEIKEFNEERERKRIATIKHLYFGVSRASLLRQLARCEKKSEDYYHKWTVIRRRDERTMWKSNLKNSIEGNAREMSLLRDAIDLFYAQKMLNKKKIGVIKK